MPGVALAPVALAPVALAPVAVPGVVVAARRNSPLVLGLGEGENFLGSDVSGFIDFTRRAVELGQDQVVTITMNMQQEMTLKQK